MIVSKGRGGKSRKSRKLVFFNKHGDNRYQQKR